MKKLILSLFIVASLVSLGSVADAQEVKIVAFGASQTAGKGVGEPDAYPAQLERILKAEGYTVSVDNQGIDGDTTRDLLSRMARAVPEATRIVILQPGTNDKSSTKKRTALTSAETRSNVEQMLAKFRERNISAILLGFPGEGGREIAEANGAVWYGPPNKNVSSDMIQADGQHFTKEGYAVLAKNMSLLIKQMLASLPK